MWKLIGNGTRRCIKSSAKAQFGIQKVSALSRHSRALVTQPGKQSHRCRSDTCTSFLSIRSDISWSPRLQSTTASFTDRQVVLQEGEDLVIQSPFEDLQLPHLPFTEYMFSKLDEHKHLDLMVDHLKDRSYTGAQLKEYSIKIASGLKKLGYMKGDVLLIFSINCPEYCMIFMACGALGVAVSTANPVYTPGELRRQLVHCGAKGVVTMPTMLPTVREAMRDSREASENIKNIFTVDGTADGCIPIQTLLEDDGKAFPENVDIDPSNTILALPYSSGTTGLPKGVMLSHANIVSNLEQSCRGQMKLRTGEDCLMGLLPFFHIYGMVVLQFGVISQGTKLIVLPKFEPEVFLQSIQKHRVNYMHLVPPVVLFLAKHPMVNDFDLSSLETMVSAAAPLGIGVTNELEKRLGADLIQAYGLSETSPITHYDMKPAKKGTIGQLLPNTRAKIVDLETGKTVPLGKEGEMLIQGPQVMMGYLNNPEATASTIKNGWLHTGDIGYMDSEGYTTISDRLKELIKYKGYQVAPAELEALLCTHPCIQEAAVVGLKAGEDVGEIPKAFVALKPNMDVKAEEILHFVEKNVAPYKKLRGGVEFVKEIPKTASGKILRRHLRDGTK